MTKKLKVTNQRFSPAAKQARAEKRQAVEAERLQREKMLDETILIPTSIEMLQPPRGDVIYNVDLDGTTIAVVRERNGRVKVHFADVHCTSVEFLNVEACQGLLTYRKVAIANMFPNGAANLAHLVRQRDAEAEGEQLRAACATQSTEGKTQTTTTKARL
jgi:hypothetical protein